jgi:tetratricopeptide (TPR) repeat protein
MRDYALERLRDSGEFTLWQLRHARMVHRFLEHCVPEIRGGNQAPWLREASRWMPEIRGALTWAFGPPLQQPAAMLLAQSSGDLWRLLSLDREGIAWLRRALDEIPADDWPPQLLGTLHCAYGQLLQRQGLLTEAAGEFGTAVELSSAAGWEHGVAIARGALAGAKAMQGDYAGAATDLDASLEYMRRADDVQLANVLATRGTVALALGDRPAARSFVEEALELARRRSNVAIQVASLNNLAVMAEHEGRTGEARTLLRESLTLRQGIGDTAGVALTSINLGSLATIEGDLDEAAEFYRSGMHVAQDLGYAPLTETALRGLAEVSVKRGDGALAATLFGAAEAMRDSIGRVLEPYAVAEHEEYMAALRSLLSSDDLDQAWSRGRGLSGDKVAALAASV